MSMVSQAPIETESCFAPRRLDLEQTFASAVREDLGLGQLVSYVSNKKVPLLGLYRFKEAFSRDFVTEFIRRFNLTPADYILDPFAGMGTTLFTAMLHGIASVGVDRLPIAIFVAKTLPKFFSLRRHQLRQTYARLLNQVDNLEPAPAAMDVPLMHKAFDPQILDRLLRWKTGIDGLPPPLKDPFLLLFFSALEECSSASNDGQFLRLKPNKQPAYPDAALLRRVLYAEHDLDRITSLPLRVEPQVYLGDARELSALALSRQPTAVITSPPYLNRYDYTRSYCLELCTHFVTNFQELRKIRREILRSHIESAVSEDEVPPHPAAVEAVDALKSKPLNNPRIPYMVTGYFVDMAKAIQEMAQVLAKNARVAMVVDNVRFEGELIPVDLILSDIAQNNGFEVLEILVCRYKGNSSQQMKKYGRVPVRESVLVWRKE